MISQEQAIQYFKKECIAHGIDPEEVDKRLKKMPWGWMCYTYPYGVFGPGMTMIHEETGEVYNFGSNPVWSPIEKTSSRKEFIELLTKIGVEHGWKDAVTPNDFIE